MLDNYHAGCIGAALTFTLIACLILAMFHRDRLLAYGFLFIVAAASAGTSLTMGLSR